MLFVVVCTQYYSTDCLKIKGIWSGWISRHKLPSRSPPPKISPTKSPPNKKSPSPKAPSLKTLTQPNLT